MSMVLGPRRQRRNELRRSRAVIAGSILLLTAAVVAGVLLWPVERTLPRPVSLGRVPVPAYVRSFGADGPEPLVEPVGAAVTGGRVYVADAARGEVVVYSSGGSRISSFGKGLLGKPLYVAYDPLDGRLYVSDRTVPGIHVFDLRGNHVRTFLPDVSEGLNGSAREWKPLALAFADNGTMYIADAGHRQRILKVGPTGKLVADAGRFVPEGAAGASVAYANGVAVTGDRVIVADSNNMRLLLFDLDLHYEGAAGFNGLPRGVCAVSWGPRPVFAVADTTGGAVRLVDRDGRVDRSFDGAGTQGGPLSEPTGVAHDGGTLLYVIDSGNRRVCVWRVVGYPRTAAPSAVAPSTRPRVAMSIALAGIAAALAAVFLRTRAREAL